MSVFALGRHIVYNGHACLGSLARDCAAVSIYQVYYRTSLDVAVVEL